MRPRHSIPLLILGGFLLGLAIGATGNAAMTERVPFIVVAAIGLSEIAVVWFVLRPRHPAEHEDTP
jgi:hypothetical protein